MAKNKSIIKVHHLDNIAIVTSNFTLKKGTIIDKDIKLTEDIPQGQKIAIEEIPSGSEVKRYGEVIGYAKKGITKGSWVKGSDLELAMPKEISKIKYEPKRNTIDDINLTKEYTFLGYKNKNGTVGIRNILGITTSVQCVVGVLDIAVQKIKELLPKYPNVDDVIALNHAYGCGVAINAKEAEIPIRTIRNLSNHSSFGGEVLVVGLGCEKLQPTRITDKNDDIIFLQEQNGFEAMINEIVKDAEVKLKELNKREREEFPLSELVIGTQCGGSDIFSGITANPSVGYAADLLVKAGATVLFSEVTEVRDAVHLLVPRAVNEDVSQKLLQEMTWYDNYLSKSNVDRSENPSPGNLKGGLSNVIEKSLGSVSKSGRSAIVDVLSPGEKVKKTGLNFAATPASDFVCGTLQAASGAHLQIFTTGRGTPYNLSMTPVIKVSTRTELKEQWADLIDVNAGEIISGEKTIEDIGWELFHEIIDVASGKRTSAEKLKIYNDIVLFNPAPIT